MRDPRAVPDEVLADDVDVGHGVDTDGDGRPDTILWSDDSDLLLATDLDADGFADRVLRIGPDGSVESDGPVPGSAHASWPEVFGVDP